VIEPARATRPEGQGRLAPAGAARRLALALLLAPALTAAAPGVPGAREREAARASAGGVSWLGPRPPASPRRVVTLAPSLTDTVVALGLADRVVGVTRYDDAPEVADRPRVGGFLDPSPEAVLALRPDLVLWMTDGGALAAVERIAALGVPVLALPIVTVKDLYAAVRLVGTALGDAAAGERLARRIEADVERVRARAARARPVRALFVVGRDPLVVAGPGSYPDEVLRLAGAVNVARGARPWPVYPLERAVADDPEVVVDGAVLEPAEGIRRLAAVPAVRAGRVVRLADDGALRPGPRLPGALEQLFSALHPEAAVAP
jgi:iron complex transport system substrate-binding protein